MLTLTNRLTAVAPIQSNTPTPQENDFPVKIYWMKTTQSLINDETHRPFIASSPLKSLFLAAESQLPNYLYMDFYHSSLLSLLAHPPNIRSVNSCWLLVKSKPEKKWNRSSSSPKVFWKKNRFELNFHFKSELFLHRLHFRGAFPSSLSHTNPNAEAYNHYGDVWSVKDN